MKVKNANILIRVFLYIYCVRQKYFTLLISKMRQNSQKTQITCSMFIFGPWGTVEGAIKTFPVERWVLGRIAGSIT